MRVFVTGGTGMIGRHLVARLVARGDTPVLLTRRPDEARRNPAWRGLRVVGGDPAKPGPWQDEVDGCDAVVNLAGENVFGGGRWNAERKARIRDSRVHAADQLVAAVRKAGQKPGVFVQGSAIGYYGASGSEPATEATPSGPDFLAVVCRELEDAARPVEALGARLATVRTGIVLEKGQGSLKVMTPIFRWLPGGAAPVGGGSKGPFGLATGAQMMSWIHINDIVGLFLLALDRDDARGPINGTAPHPVSNFDFSKALAKVLRRPFLKVGPPDVVLRALFGEFADTITKGRAVLPARAEALGYRFLFPDLPGALEDVFRRKREESPTPPRPAAHAGAHH